MKKRLLLFYFICCYFFSLYAVIPSGYYNGTEGKKTAKLKTLMHNIICRDTSNYLGYGSGPGNTWQGFYYTDRNLTTNAVIDMYSDSVRYFPNPNPNFVSFGQAIHIEHSMPKSWWGCDIENPDCAARDLHHLYPADGPTNSSKNDNPLGIVSTATFYNSVSKVGQGSYPGYTGPVFEPADQYKGDFARSYLYMATAYEHYVNKWDISKSENMMQNNRYPALKPGAIELLLQWSRQDPVSEKELTRTEVVYSIQGNRNPFIDYPLLAEYIWGNRSTIPFRADGNINFPYLTYPNSEDSINFGRVYYSQSPSTTIPVKGMNLTGDLSIAITGTNATDFSVNSSTITQDQAVSDYNLVITFSASTLGAKNALLTISGGGIDPINIYLTATRTDDFVTLPATDITSNSFNAHWTASSSATNYSLNVFKIQPTGEIISQTLLNETFDLDLPNTWTREGLTYRSTGSIRLATADNPGALYLPTLNLSAFPTLLTVKASRYSNDIGAVLTASYNGTNLAQWTTTASFQNYTFVIPPTNDISRLKLSAVGGSRVVLDNVKVESQIPVIGRVYLPNYPLMVGNNLSASVNGLESNETYYYTVTPIGNGGQSSDSITVKTSVSTSLKQLEVQDVFYTKTKTGVTVKRVPQGCKIIVFDCVGKMILSTKTVSDEILLSLPKKGLYLLQVQDSNQTNSLKIIY